MSSSTAHSAPKKGKFKKGKFKKFVVRAGIVGAVAFVGIQFVPVDGVGKNPEGDRYMPDMPKEVEAIMRKACFDCHTNETAWPWYARMAPASWLVIRDVKKGRSHLNFSEWEDLEEELRAPSKEESWELLEKSEMPPWFYIPMHPGALLSDAEKATLKAWLLAKPPEPAAAPAKTDAGPQKDSDAR